MLMVILRGVSGAGKSTKAKELIEEFRESNPDGVTYVCSADHFFIDPASGEYKFDPKKIGTAHAWCKGNAHAALSLGVDLVIIDNTNTQRWEFEPYVDLADHFGYECELCTVGELDDASLKVYANRNSHGVPLEAIRRMAKRFE